MPREYFQSFLKRAGSSLPRCLPPQDWNPNWDLAMEKLREAKNSGDARATALLADGGICGHDVLHAIERLTRAMEGVEEYNDKMYVLLALEGYIAGDPGRKISFVLKICCPSLIHMQIGRMEQGGWQHLSVL